MASSFISRARRRLAEWGRERHVSKPSASDLALILLCFTLIPAVLYASPRLLYAALIALNRLGEYRLAALLIFLNNQSVAALVACATLAAGRVGWPPLLSREGVSRHAREASLLLASATFIVSLARHWRAVSPSVILLPHFWCEYTAIAFAAYAGFSSKPRFLLYSTALLLLGATLETYTIYLLQRV